MTSDNKKKNRALAVLSGFFGGWALVLLTPSFWIAIIGSALLATLPDILLLNIIGWFGLGVTLLIAFAFSSLCAFSLDTILEAEEKNRKTFEDNVKRIRNR